MKKYVIIAGVNGAGKTTLYKAFPNLQSMNRINTDDIVRENKGAWDNPSDVAYAGKIAVKRIKEYFGNGQSFNQETTLCGNSIIRNINKAIQLEYYIEVHYVGLDNVNIAKERVQARVSVGGHGVPEQDIERRYVQSFKNLSKIITKCNEFIFYDNTIKFERIAYFENGKKLWDNGNLPNWFIKWIA